MPKNLENVEDILEVEIANLKANSSLLTEIDNQLENRFDYLTDRIDMLEDRDEVDEEEVDRLTDEQETLGGQIYLLEEWLKWFGRRKELLEKMEEPSEKDKDWFRASDAWFKAVDIVLNKRENENEVIQNDLDLESDVHIIPTSSDSYTWEKVLHYVKANLDGLVN